MNEREQILLNNHVFTGSILLDSRNKVILTETQIEDAKTYINQARCIFTRLYLEMYGNIENFHLDSSSLSVTSQSSQEDIVETFLKIIKNYLKKIMISVFKQQRNGCLSFKKPCLFF